MCQRPDDDLELVRRARDGDRAAFSQLAERERPRLLALGRRWFGDGYLAEEVAQEALIRAFEHLPTLRHPAAFQGWLMTIARNVARQRLRAQEVREAFSPADATDLPAVPDPAGQVALWDAVGRAQEALPPTQQAAAELCLLQGYSTEEAAEALCLPLPVVKGRLQRARQTLRKELGEIMPTKKEARGRAPLILVVDDEAHVARLIRVNLEAAGYRVVVAGDGIEACERVEQRVPDLITLDLMMPRMDGLSFLRWLRARPETLLTPVAVVSARSADDPRTVELSDLIDLYIQLPFNPLQLLVWVDRRLGHMTAEQRADLAGWRELRFGEGLTPEAAASMLSGHYWAVEAETRAVLAEMGPAAIPALAKAAAEGDAKASAYAMNLLSRRPESEATEALAGLLCHPERGRRWEALAALGSLANDAALAALVDRGEPVLAEVVAALSGTDERQQQEACSVLRRVKTPEALRALRDYESRPGQ